ncbi:hypothetical protein DFA_00675 [Cavenderia fasciculata]|uniref:Guanylate cyclase domain-containing protein n=1 Tax=Cavenderia fasciculata TaxID=261658 RepID=F4PT74_CACFS|nr:uncharacterized protein DFA_00675 [Cavenderia fasciculata]EGG20810.1 hypothetical protein DFA_00675 [Cavenderia fasciculata]|eukprot:XP_004358660.1 hypothetical protein DFA_00675 [Cavenderia fasciculata]
MKEGELYVAEECSGVSIIFADIVNFTKISSTYSPKDLVLMLNRLYSTFDDISESMGLEKIKTIGDSYMVVCGLPWHEVEGFSPDMRKSNSSDGINFYLRDRTVYHANKALNFALNILESVKRVNQKYGYDLHLRVGINTGDVVIGVIGKKKFTFDLWGDAVNLASRMESLGIPDRVSVSETTYNLVSDKYDFEKQVIDVKGKGDMGLFVHRPSVDNGCTSTSTNQQEKEKENGNGNGNDQPDKQHYNDQHNNNNNNQNDDSPPIFFNGGGGHL